MLIDTHAHLNFKEFNDEIPEVIKRAKLAGVGVIINVGSNFETSTKTIEIANLFSSSAEHENSVKLYAAVGCHPIHLVKDITEEATFDSRVYKFKTKQEIFDYEKYKKLAQSSDKVVAIGETGIDIFRIEDEKHNLSDIIKLQSDILRQHIKLAKELNLPLILHPRGKEKDSSDAYEIIIKILKEEKYFNGVAHCYIGNLTNAKKFIKLGFYLGFTGIVTFKNALEIQEVARQIPLEKILIETDCPFLAPAPYRGKRNEPAYVVEVARKIAELKKIPLVEVEKATTQNAKKLFNLSTN